ARPGTVWGRRRRRRTGAAKNSCDGWAPRTAWPRRSVSPASELLPALDAILAFRIDDRDEADDAAVAAVPIPREEREGAALAGDLVEVAADILDAEDAVLEQLVVHRLPLREVIGPVAAAGPGVVFFLQMRQQRTVALRA